MKFSTYFSACELDLYYVVNKLAARCVILSAEARTLVADCNVLLLHSKDVSSYIDLQKQFNENSV